VIVGNQISFHSTLNNINTFAKGANQMETTINLNEDTIKNVQNLISINIDSCKGFKAAADHIENDRIANYFRECSIERDRLAQELQVAIAVNGEAPEDDGSLKGAAHRWWMNIRSTVTGGDEHTVLADAERGEDEIKGLYEKTLKDTAGSPLNALLQSQYAKVKVRHDEIRDMRDDRA
tara:strand:- start:183 stop:716 length:534 start_codon:yes stop_codon:yes gene_type:complete